MGRLYNLFMKYIVQSGYIDKLCVHSMHEIEYYVKCLDIDRNKLEFVRLGISDDSQDYSLQKPKQLFFTVTKICRLKNKKGH